MPATSLSLSLCASVSLSLSSGDDPVPYKMEVDEPIRFRVRSINFTHIKQTGKGKHTRVVLLPFALFDPVSPLSSCHATGSQMTMTNTTGDKTGGAAAAQVSHRQGSEKKRNRGGACWHPLGSYILWWCHRPSGSIRQPMRGTAAVTREKHMVHGVLLFILQCHVHVHTPVSRILTSAVASWVILWCHGPSSKRLLVYMGPSFRNASASIDHPL